MAYGARRTCWYAKPQMPMANTNELDGYADTASLLLDSPCLVVFSTTSVTSSHTAYLEHPGCSEKERDDPAE